MIFQLSQAAITEVIHIHHHHRIESYTIVDIGGLVQVLQTMIIKDIATLLTVIREFILLHKDVITQIQIRSMHLV